MLETNEIVLFPLHWAADRRKEEEKRRRDRAGSSFKSDNLINSAYV